MACRLVVMARCLCYAVLRIDFEYFCAFIVEKCLRHCLSKFLLTGISTIVYYQTGSADGLLVTARLFRLFLGLSDCMRTS